MASKPLVARPETEVYQTWSVSALAGLVVERHHAVFVFSMSGL